MMRAADEIRKTDATPDASHLSRIGAKRPAEA